MRFYFIVEGRKYEINLRMGFFYICIVDCVERSNELKVYC